MTRPPRPPLRSALAVACVLAGIAAAQAPLALDPAALDPAALDPAAPLGRGEVVAVDLGPDGRLYVLQRADPPVVVFATGATGKARWVRFAAWDVATNGALARPVYVAPADSGPTPPPRAAAP